MFDPLDGVICNAEERESANLLYVQPVAIDPTSPIVGINLVPMDSPPLECNRIRSAALHRYV